VAQQPDERAMLEAIYAGADGYLPARIRGDRLPVVLRSLAAGEIAFPRELTARYVQELRRRPALDRPPIALVKRGLLNRTVFYMPRFIRHFDHRLRSGMSLPKAWRSARHRMRAYR